MPRSQPPSTNACRSGAGDEDDDEEENGGIAKKGLPEKKKKKLLDASTWERDARLVETAMALRNALGDTLYEDHNVFRDRVDAALKQAEIKLSAADRKQIFRAVSRRVESAPPVIAKVHKPRSIDGSEELLSVSHITGVTPRSQKNITMFKAASYAGHKLCRPGDLVVNTMWAWMGALGVSTHAGIVSSSYAVYRPHRPENIVGIYIDGLLRSRPYVSNIICRSTGLHSSRLRLYPEEFFRLPIIQPPPEEQRRIVQGFEAETADLNNAISRLEREIELLREYRTRLVADVVTGKLDVRRSRRGFPTKPGGRYSRG